MTAQFALFASAKEDADIFTLILIPVVTRTVAGLCVTVLRPLTTSEYSGEYKKAIRKSHVAFLSVVTAAVFTAGFVFLGRYGFVSLATAAGYLLYMSKGYKSLGGMSGDISGYALTFGELCGIIAFVLL